MDNINPAIRSNIRSTSPTRRLTIKPSIIANIGINAACEASGIRWATAVWVCAALSSMVFLIFPEGFVSKNLKLAFSRPSMPFLRRLVSSLKANIWDNSPEII